MNQLRIGMLLTAVVFVCHAPAALAQDAVFKTKAAGGASRLTGKVSAMTPDGVTIDGKVIPSSDIRRISIGKQPSSIARLHEHLNSGRYSDCLAGIEKLTAPLKSPVMQQEIAFMKAFSTARLALTSGTTGTREAGEVVAGFLKNHPESYHTFPATEQYGMLIYSFGRPAAAAQEFAKLKKASWKEMRWRGFFMHGRMMQIEGQLELAKQDYQAILSDTSTDPITVQYQRLADCEVAKLEGLAGSAGPAIEKLRQLIKNQTRENPQVFACVYNAMGAIYENTGQLKNARTAYLHNTLLFRGEVETAAEAAYRLSKLWPQLNQPGRANEARKDLKSSFRYSYWANIVDKPN